MNKVQVHEREREILYQQVDYSSPITYVKVRVEENAFQLFTSLLQLRRVGAQTLDHLHTVNITNITHQLFYTVLHTVHHHIK
jgi:hypothetical protein